jgi:hypothetical protein
MYLTSILKGSDDGVLYLIKPRFWTLSIVSGYKNTTFRELVQWERLALSKGPNWVGPLFYLMTGAEPAPETLWNVNLRRWTKSKKRGFIMYLTCQKEIVM